MRFLKTLVPSILLACATIAQAASSWTFDEATISIQSKGKSSGSKESLSATKPISQPISFGASDTLKLLLTTKEDGTAKRPHQAFLVLKESATGLETAFALSVKDTGKGKVDITQKDLPIQFLLSSTPLEGRLVIASFGLTKPLSTQVFKLQVKLDPNVAAPTYEKPVRYGKLPQINHIFKSDPKNPPRIISAFFVLVIMATVPILLGVWGFLDANLDQLQSAFSRAPISYTLFYGSIVAMEGIFFLYYCSWTLFQILPVAGAVGVVAFVSGSKALSEVQARRLAGER